MVATKRRKPAPETHVHDPSKFEGKLKFIGGSMADDWNLGVANQAVNAIWHHKGEDPDEASKKRHAVLDVLIGIAPKDEFEGMIAAQLVACHNASMECYRRSMLPDQPFEGRRENLSQANKLSRTYTTLLEALNRHRGKGQQKVTVEHVHVHDGGQAIVGNVTPGGGAATKSKDQPHAITHAPQPEVWRPDTKRDLVPVPSNAERPLPDARRTVARSTEG